MTTPSISAPVSSAAGTRQALTPDVYLLRNAATIFAIFAAFALWAFWPGYFSNPFRGIQPEVHVHAILMAVWCLLLVAQPLLIRLHRRPLHRLIGKFSYFLAPAIFVSGLGVAQFSVSTRELTGDALYQRFGHFFMAFVSFVVIYGFAIWFRKDPRTHARFMLCTIFPLFNPVFARIIGNNFGFVFEALPLPVVAGLVLRQVVGFGVADLALLSLIALDWRSPNRRVNAFAISLTVLLAYHISDFFLYQIGPWRSFVDGVMTLPLS